MSAAFLTMTSLTDIRSYCAAFDCWVLPVHCVKECCPILQVAIIPFSWASNTATADIPSCRSWGGAISLQYGLYVIPPQAWRAL